MSRLRNTFDLSKRLDWLDMAVDVNKKRRNPTNNVYFVNVRPLNKRADEAIQTIKIINQDKSFMHTAIRYKLCFAQFFGLMPIYGIRQGVQKLSFRWKSFKTVYSIIVIILLTSTTILSLCYSWKIGSNFFTFVPFIWNLRSLFGMIASLRAAQNWPLFMADWYKMETRMNKWENLPNLKRETTKLAIFVFVFGLSAHSLYLSAILIKILSKPDRQLTLFNAYFTRSYPEVFAVFDYNIITGIFVEFLNCISRVSWQFINYVLIIFSTETVLRFQQINNKLKNMKRIEIDGIFLNTLKQDYTQLCLCCEKLNHALSDMIKISFLGGVYFLCAFINTNIENNIHILTRIYYYYSGIFIVGHISCVIYFMACIHEESLVILDFLFQVPSKYYDKHVDQLLKQIECKSTVLTFGDIFQIKKTLVLGVTNAVVALQLIIMQAFKTIRESEN